MRPGRSPRRVRRAIDRRGEDAGHSLGHRRSHKDCVASGEHSRELATQFFDLLLDEKVAWILEGHTHPQRLPRRK